jgi:hypothetical protein
MKEEITMSLYPIGELRPNFHKLVSKPARMALNLWSRHLGRSKTAKHGPSPCLMPSDAAF